MSGRYLAMLLLAIAVGGCSQAANASAVAPADPGYRSDTDAEGNVAETDTTGKGAVMCIWGIYVGLQQIGDTCFAGQDQDFKAQLADSIARTDRFIIANSPERVTQADLEARKQYGRAEAVQFGLCSGDGVQMYRMMRDQGPAALKAGTDELLSIPRKPVMNPCL